MTGAGPSRVTARRLGLALGLAFGLVAASCGGGDVTEETSQDAQWGPLAVADFASGDEALTAGTVQITDRCVLLERRNESVLLVWPQARTTWDSQDMAVGFVTLSGERVVFRNGDRVTFVGGGSSVDEDGLTAGDFLASVDWVAEPNRACVADARWFVGDPVNDKDSSAAP